MHGQEFDNVVFEIPFGRLVIIRCPSKFEECVNSWERWCLVIDRNFISVFFRIGLAKELPQTILSVQRDDAVVHREITIPE